MAELLRHRTYRYPASLNNLGQSKYLSGNFFLCILAPRSGFEPKKTSEIKFSINTILMINENGRPIKQLQF